jgi:hypothetical protein
VRQSTRRTVPGGGFAGDGGGKIERAINRAPTRAAIGAVAGDPGGHFGIKGSPSGEIDEVAGVRFGQGLCQAAFAGAGTAEKNVTLEPVVLALLLAWP